MGPFSLRDLIEVGPRGNRRRRLVAWIVRRGVRHGGGAARSTGEFSIGTSEENYSGFNSGLSVSDDTIYRALKNLGFSHVSARPKAYKQKAEAVGVFKRN